VSRIAKDQAEVRDSRGERQVALVDARVRGFGIPRPFVARLFATWPSAGFHWRLVTLTLDRFRSHPLTPLPMVKL
jgi:hypothetical protein